MGTGCRAMTLYGAGVRVMLEENLEALRGKRG